MPLELFHHIRGIYTIAFDIQQFTTGNRHDTVLSCLEG